MSGCQVDEVVEVEDRLRGHVRDGCGWVSLARPSAGWVWTVPTEQRIASTPDLVSNSAALQVGPTLFYLP